MRIGTKSVLFGAHQFLIHPLVLALSWWKLYGFSEVWIGTRVRYLTLPGPGTDRGPWPFQWAVTASLRDYRLWLAFFLHDIGYLGKPNMDGPEGESHPEKGAALMRRWFGDAWGDFCLFHSRYYAKRAGRNPSVLCRADKLAIALEPSWLYLPRVWASGELTEYLTQSRAADIKASGLSPALAADLVSGNPWRWHKALRVYMARWVKDHPEGTPDRWTAVRPSLTTGERL